MSSSPEKKSTVTAESPEGYQWVGKSEIRPDGVEKVTGRAKFGADFTLPGTLVGKILRSPHAHADIISINTAKAEQLPGVKAIITAKDFPEIPPSEALIGGEPPNMADLSDNILARNKVLYDGHAIAAVAATSAAIADEALALIEVEYNVLPHVIDVEDAMAEGAPILHNDLFTDGVHPKPDAPSNIAKRVTQKVGDTASGFEQADVIVEGSFTTAAVHQGYIEPHAAIATFNEDGQLQIWCSSQGQFMVRAYTAKVLGMEIAQIRVNPLEIGGGFGGKTTIYLEPVAALLAKKSARPVKLVMTRDEVLRASGPTSGSKITLKIGATRDGKLVAAEGELKYQAGAYPGSPVMLGCMCAFACYELPNMFLVGYDVVSNRPKCAAYRAPGAPMIAFAVESLLDDIANQLGMDPLQFRLHNAVEEGSKATYGPKFRQIGFKETLQAALNHPHYSAPLGENQGRGVASGFWFNIGGPTTAALNINEDGTAVLVSGNPDIGGSRASLALMAAEKLGIDYAQVRPIVADTASVSYSMHTGGSRVTFSSGMAISQAADNIITDLKRRAAKIWDIDPEHVRWEDGMAIGPSHDSIAEGGQEEQQVEQQLSLKELAASSAKTGGPIGSSVSLTATGAGPGFGTHIVDVEVDPDTGYTTILRYTAVQDVGKAIHPAYVEGQLQGGVAQGIGWALNEEYIYDKNGKLLNSGFLDYRMPVASDLPMIDTVLVEVPNPRHPFGVRGVGEVPIVPVMGAVANAVKQATGKRPVELPMSPPKMVKLLQEG
ncbi:xanthine dehydrogenase family protein molybdopterin-binding subunit [Aurantivibrio plasticivorans]